MGGGGGGLSILLTILSGRDFILQIGIYETYRTLGKEGRWKLFLVVASENEELRCIPSDNGLGWKMKPLLCTKYTPMQVLQKKVR